MYNYSKLDREEVLSLLFHPRHEERTPSPENSCDFDCAVEENCMIGCRFHAAGPDAPTIIYFHGNGETVADYDQIGPMYTRFGMNVLFTTYRGYGWSTGSPTVSNMFADTDVILQKAQQWLEEKGFNGPLFTMGRSLGSACAIEMTENHPDTFKGMIIESGFSDTVPLLENLGFDTASIEMTEEYGFGNSQKIENITVPTLILHGSNDVIIPVKLAEKLQSFSGARAKQFLVIPGAEHNTMITTGGDKYFETLKSFIDKTCGITKWQYRRRSYKKPTS